jgi:hypothetical protein
LHIDECTTKESDKKISGEFKEEEQFPKKQNMCSQINSLDPSIIQSFKTIDKTIPFESKLETFRKHMKSLKVDWREGCCTLDVQREKILSQSMEQITFIDLFKELKINFLGEVSSDAGGLIREWYAVIFKELQCENRSELFT